MPSRQQSIINRFEMIAVRLLSRRREFVSSWLFCLGFNQSGSSLNGAIAGSGRSRMQVSGG
jgi:hypothetical protein